MEERKITKTVEVQKHNVMMEDRSRISISGVDDVESFDDETVIAYTVMGEMTIKGADFKISKLNVDTGELIIDGEIDSIEYASSEKREKGGSIFGRLFK